MGNSCNRKRLTSLTIAAMLGTAAPALADMCDAEQVRLRGDWGEARFSIEVADDAEEHARGLMFRESMPTSAGMLFIYEIPRTAQFWMKNTLIPLDMIFIDPTGRVVSIFEEAQPHDETPTPPAFNTLAVLEINGGLSKQLGIKVGAEVQHPVFAENAVWPC